MFEILEPFLKPNRDSFGRDPFGYSALAWHTWGMAQEYSGFSVDLDRMPSSDELKSPVLWLTHAHAMSEAGVHVIRNEPGMNQIPDLLKGVCDSQYCAVGLMLVGYSLEICLKAMLIMKLGVTEYSKQEKKHRHHRLDELSKFVPDLSEKDKAMLKVLTHFVSWAGRYPDPGAGYEKKVQEIFDLSEEFEMSAHELFKLSSRVMGHAKHVVEAL